MTAPVGGRTICNLLIVSNIKINGVNVKQEATGQPVKPALTSPPRPQTHF